MGEAFELHIRGEKSAVVAAITGLGNSLGERGVLSMANPMEVAAGDGWIHVEIHQEDRGDARAALGAVLDQIPGFYDLIADGDLGPSDASS